MFIDSNCADRRKLANCSFFCFKKGKNVSNTHKKLLWYWLGEKYHNASQLDRQVKVEVFKNIIREIDNVL